MSVVHFDAKGRGLMWAGRAECGASISGFCGTATDPAAVTCKRCQRTKAYRDAAAVPAGNLREE